MIHDRSLRIRDHANVHPLSVCLSVSNILKLRHLRIVQGDVRKPPHEQI